MDNSLSPVTPDPGPDPQQHRVRLSSPADILAVIPHMLGFHPAKSLVVIGAGGSRERVQLGFRYDLPDPPASDAAAEIADHAVSVLARRDISTVIVVGYGPGRLVTPLVDALTKTAGSAGLRLREVLRVESGRYWSYLCGNIECCPPEGVPFDNGAHPAAAAMVAAGLPAFPDRESRARLVAPPTGALAADMDGAADRACDRATALMTQSRRRNGRKPLAGVIAAGRVAVREAIETYRGGGRLSGADAIAWLAVCMTNLAVRDDAWARMDPEHREAHLRLWTDVVSHVGDLWVPGPASLLAFTAWQCGDGALANIAIERALAADPQYSLALLLRDVIDAGVPPSAARVPMTPEEVARSYDEPEGSVGDAGPGRAGDRVAGEQSGVAVAGRGVGAGVAGEQSGAGASGDQAGARPLADPEGAPPARGRRSRPADGRAGSRPLPRPDEAGGRSSASIHPRRPAMGTPVPATKRSKPSGYTS